MDTHSSAERERLLRAAELYEREYVPTVGRPMAYGLLSAAQPCSHEQVLDVACGTGIVARTAAEAVGDVRNVTGLDPSETMLEVAASKGPVGMNWVHGRAEAIPLPDDSFTLVLCLQGLQYFTDRHQALAEILRVLAPGGRLASLTPGPTPEFMQTMAETLGEHVGAHARGFIERIFELGEAGEVTTLLSGAGFRDVHTTSSTATLTLPPPLDTFDMYVAATPLAPMVAVLDDVALHRLRADFVERCSHIPDPTKLEIDYVVVLGSKP